MRHMPSTYSLAKPQSRLASRLPSSSTSSLSRTILATESVILRVTNSRPRSGDSWLNRMPRGTEDAIALAVIDRHPVRVQLGHAIRAARVERGVLDLRDGLHLAEHFRGRRLVEADLRVDQADGLEQVDRAQAGDRRRWRAAGRRTRRRNFARRGCRPRPARRSGSGAGSTPGRSGRIRPATGSDGPGCRVPRYARNWWNWYGGRCR